MIKINKNIVNKAIETAVTSNVRRGKVAAVIYTDRGEILATSCNTRFYREMGSGKFTIHAEEMVLSKAYKMCLTRRYNNLNMFVLRYKRETKSIAIAKPCEKCQILLKNWDFPVYYTTEYGIERLK